MDNNYALTWALASLNCKEVTFSIHFTQRSSGSVTNFDSFHHQHSMQLVTLQLDVLAGGSLVLASRHLYIGCIAQRLTPTSFKFYSYSECNYCRVIILL